MKTKGYVEIDDERISRKAGAQAAIEQIWKEVREILRPETESSSSSNDDGSDYTSDEEEDSDEISYSDYWADDEDSNSSSDDEEEDCFLILGDCAMFGFNTVTAMSRAVSTS